MTMDHEAALASIAADGVPRRLEAARYLERNARPEDLARLRSRAQAEPDELIARVLRRAITRSNQDGESSSPIPQVSDELLIRERARAVRDATGMFLHEMSPLIGHLEVVAAGLVTDYSDSALHAEVERIRETLEAFEDLRTAAEAHDLVEFNLTDAVGEVVQAEARTCGRVQLSAASGGSPARDEYDVSLLSDGTPRQIEVTVAREDPVVTSGSPRLIRLVLANAVRNAFDACDEVVEDRGARVVVSWGATDLDAWISVVDDGPGLHPSLASPWEVGATSKKPGTHRGLGLVIVRQAVQSMNGHAELSDGEVGGCHFEVRWPTGGNPS